MEAGLEGVGSAGQGESGAEDAVVMGRARGEDDAGSRGEMRFEEVSEEEGAEEVGSVDGWEAAGSKFLAW